MTTRRARLRPAVACAGVLVAAICAACSSPHPTTHDEGIDGQAVIRFDQVGYISGETKTAFVMGSNTLGDNGFTVRDAKGQSVASGSLGAGRGGWNSRYPSVRLIDFTAVTTPGTYTLAVDGVNAAATIRIDSASALVLPLLSQNVQFFQAQRDGADVIASVQRRKPSHLNDQTASVYQALTLTDDGTALAADLTPTGNTADVEGGWFDAGDFLKFTGTTAYATADLLLAQRTEQDAGIEVTSGLTAEALHGLSWLTKMWDPRTGVLYVQVGTGVGNDDVTSDHDVWRLPESDDAQTAAKGDPRWWLAHRPVFAANEAGEPVPPNLAGRVAAAFALAAQTAPNPQDARLWLDRAAAIYAAGDTSDDPKVIAAFPAEFYPEESGNDDMEFAAAELARAAFQLGDGRAADWVTQGNRWAARYLAAEEKGTLELGDVSALGHAELIAMHAPDSPALIADLRRQLDDGMAAAKTDPFGAGADQTGFDSVPHAFGLATTATLYERVTGDDRYARFASEQRSWVLGANAWGSSFVIGAGAVSPRCPEHQVANLAGGGPLVGAVVNGPNATDLLTELNRFDTMKDCAFTGPDGAMFTEFDRHDTRYVDDVGAWQTVEPALDFTSTAAYSLALTATQ